MKFYSYLFTAHYRKFFADLKKVAAKEKRSFLCLLFKAIYLMLRYGYGMADFLNYELYKKSRSERMEYLSTKDENEFYEKASPSAYKKRYTVKPAFLADFKKYTKRDFLVPEEGGFAEFEAFIKKHPVFMSKPYDGLAGQDVTKEYADKIADKEAFFDNAVAKHLFFEELILQHPDMNALCPTSVNTMRMITFNDHGKPRLIWLCLRVGNGINHVDNFHARGVAAKIDENTGRLIGDAVDKELNYYSEHPFTHVKFDGFQIPCFEEAKKMVLEAALESDKILVVGWDVAISENGPVIVEGNRRPGFDLVQVVSGRGRMDIVRDVLSKISDIL